MYFFIPLWPSHFCNLVLSKEQFCEKGPTSSESPMVLKRQDEAIQMGQSMSNLQSREHVSFNLVVMAITCYCNLVPWPSLKMPRI
jgi:hypothetical protein